MVGCVQVYPVMMLVVMGLGLFGMNLFVVVLEHSYKKVRHREWLIKQEAANVVHQQEGYEANVYMEGEPGHKAVRDMAVMSGLDHSEVPVDGAKGQDDGRGASDIDHELHKDEQKDRAAEKAVAASFGDAELVHESLGAAVGIDTTGDGIEDAFDTNGDGVINLRVTGEGKIGYDMNGDGKIDAFDTTGDGRVDSEVVAEVDSNGDGTADSMVLKHLDDADLRGTAFPNIPGVSVPLYHLVTSKNYDRCISLVIVFNAAAMATYSYPAQDTVQSVGIFIETLCMIIFTAEFVVKMVGLGAGPYFHVPFNTLDFFVVVVSLGTAMLAMFDSDHIEPGGPSGSLRIMRLLFRIIRFMKMLKLLQSSAEISHLIRALTKTSRQLLNMSFLIFFVLMMMAIITMHTLGRCHMENNQLPEVMPARPNFFTFWDSFLAHFQVMTGEDWTLLMFSYMKLCGGEHKYVKFGVVRPAAASDRPLFSASHLEFALGCRRIGCCLIGRSAVPPPAGRAVRCDVCGVQLPAAQPLHRHRARELFSLRVRQGEAPRARVPRKQGEQ